MKTESNTEKTDNVAKEALPTAYCPLERASVEGYQPETWTVKKDLIIASVKSMEIGLENTQELLINHDATLGRTTKSNKRTAELMEAEINTIELNLVTLRNLSGMSL